MTKQIPRTWFSLVDPETVPKIHARHAVKTNQETQLDITKLMKTQVPVEP